VVIDRLLASFVGSGVSPLEACSVGDQAMNEVRLLKVSEPLTAEVEAPDDQVSRPMPPLDQDPSVIGPEETPPAERMIKDRRVAHRHRAVNGRCWIGWHDGVAFQNAAAWIIDISVSGTLVATDVPPPADRSIWLRLDNHAVPDWTETRVVEVQTSQRGICAARLVFRHNCPYVLIKAVAFAVTGSQPAGPEPSTSWKLNNW
jgi:hypothetical protein